MARFTIEETIPCYVTWCRTVEAETEAEALDRFNEGDGDPVGGGMIGDCLDGYGGEQRVIRVEPSA